MTNKGILWVFVSLLVLATLYMLSFGFVANSFEKRIEKMAYDSLATSGLSGRQLDSAATALKRTLLRDSSEAKVYPLFGHSYREVKENELNLGLDLQGGMSVTLEVSIPELIYQLSGKSDNPQFLAAIETARQMQKNSSDNFVTLFERAWKSQNNGTELWRIFSTPDNKDMFPPKSSDEDIFRVLAQQADDAISNTENIIKKRIDQFGVAQPTVQKQALSGRIVVELPGVSDRERVRKQLKSTANLEFWETYRLSEIAPAIQKLNDTLGKMMHPELFTAKADSAKKADTAPAGDTTQSDTTKTDDSGIDTSSATTDSTATEQEKTGLTEEDRKRNPLFTKLGVINQGNSVMVGIAKVSDTAEVNRMINSPIARQLLPPDLRLLWGAKTNQNVATLYSIRDLSMKGKAKLDGKSIVNAAQDFQPVTGEVVCRMIMDSDRGAEIWSKMTETAAADNQRPIAIVMDNLVYSAPSVREKIPNGESVITLGGGPQANTNDLITEAKDLASLLKAGSLPAPAKIIDEVTVGPSIGAENIRAGWMSFAIAFIAILIYMVFYYAWAGIAANIALIANLFFMLGALIGLHGSLTLPGVAGIVLTMGMAVDANVLIYERIKEELRHGKGTSAAMKDGFLKAISAIVDGNLTTLLTGLVLFIIGTGPIKGFATTLIIGIFTTLFTAIIVSRLILYRRLEKKKPITFYSSITKNWFTKVNYDFVGKRKLFYGLSLAIIAAGTISMFTRGFNMGVDFIGGTAFRVKFEQPVNVDQLRSALNETLVDGNKTSSNTVQTVENDGTRFKIATNYLIDNNDPQVENMIQAKLSEALTKITPGFVIESNNKVDPTMSDDFRKEALWSTIIGLILVGIYIFIRFRKLNFAVGAAVALLHDALVALCAYTLLNGIIPITLEVNQAFVGAILTIIGYSINDTVVIFDRIREYMGQKRGTPMKQTINDALNSTLGRSVNTSMTVLLTLLVMFIFGSDDIRGFCFAMIVGVISGVYSSLFIAAPIVVDMERFAKTGEEKQSDKAKAVTATA